MRKLLISIGFVAIYILGGLLVEYLFDSHPVTALFGYFTGVLSLSVIQEEQTND